MILNEVTNSEAIDALIAQKKSFAIYRIPGEEAPHFRMQTSGAVRLLYTMEELNGQQGFVIAPFRVSKECPMILIQPDCYELPKIREDVYLSTHRCEVVSQAETAVEQKVDREAYLDCFDRFSAPLKEQRFKKLVLSRPFTLNRKRAFSPAEAFYRACQRYLYSYVYLFYTPQTGVWLGSTPEVILSGEKGVWQTAALAGTQSLQQGKLPLNWDDKNLEEQEVVATYIRQQLLMAGIHPVEEGPYAARAGELAHLKSDFHFSLSNVAHLGNLLKLLHPTPAVCGLPKEEAYRFILTNEGYDRHYYSGFIGCLNPEGKTDLYVNLRCMHVGNELLTLYAGGGLLASSEVNDEWQETENKLQTMLAIVGNETN